MQIRPSWDLAAQNNPECLGLVYAVLGKFQDHHSSLAPRIVLVKQCERIGDLRSHDIYKVVSVILLAVNQDPVTAAQLGLKPCPKHHSHNEAAQSLEESETALLEAANNPLAKLKDAVKSTAGNVANQVKAPFASKSTVLSRFAFTYLI